MRYNNRMAKFIPAIEEKIRRAIRDAMAIDPLMTQTALCEAVSKRLNHNFDRQYIGKLANKVMAQARAEIDHTSIAQRLTQSRETHRLAREKLIRILFWTPENAIAGMKPPLPTEYIMAAEALVKLDLAIFNMEVANGVYAKREEVVAKELRTVPLLPEVRRDIVNAMKAWGVKLPAPKKVEALPEPPKVVAPPEPPKPQHVNIG